MQYITCINCHKSDIPLNESIKVDDSQYCHACFEDTFQDDLQLVGKQIENGSDATVCGFCAKNFGDTQLPQLSNYYICPDCEIDVKNKTFPTWVKAFFAVVVVLVVFSIVWNWRFYQGYTHLNASLKAFSNQNYQAAADLIQKASQEVPENLEVKFMASYYRGLNFMTLEKYVEAVKELESCKNGLPRDFEIPILITRAKIGAAFDKKDYDEFIKIAEEELARDSSYIDSWLSLSSAYACKYAQSGQDSAKTKAIQCINRAKIMDQTNPEVIQTSNRIEHRLYTREIIDQNEFVKRYPNGWSKN